MDPPSVPRRPVVEPDLDCGFDHDGRWFRYRAAAVILDGSRILMAANDRDPYLYSVGGGVHHGEAAEDAVRREVREETGADLTVERLLFIHEHFFVDSASPLRSGRRCHELTFYFLMHCPDPAALRATGITNDGVRERLVWVDLDHYGRDLPAYPEFFATELRPLPASPRLVTKR